MANDERKIFIDEDWKSQVERERQTIPPPAAPVAPPVAAVPDAPAAPLTEEERKSAIFEEIISMLASQTMLALGLLYEEGQTEVMVDLPMAAMAVEMLMVLREKTKGNLSPTEEGALTQTISELQRVFAQRAQAVQLAALKQQGAPVPPGLHVP